jgi:hypothetical protein
VKGRKRNVSKVSRLSIILSRFTRYTASSKGYYLREIDLLSISDVLFIYVVGELKAENDIAYLFIYLIVVNFTYIKIEGFI